MDLFYCMPTYSMLTRRQYIQALEELGAMWVGFMYEDYMNWRKWHTSKK